jgi:hypothetical protein
MPMTSGSLKIGNLYYDTFSAIDKTYLVMYVGSSTGHVVAPHRKWYTFYMFERNYIYDVNEIDLDDLTECTQDPGVSSELLLSPPIGT